jgi:hypothetical protein
VSVSDVSRRPTDLAGMQAALSGFGTDAGRARGLALRPRPSDVFISPYSKCGTTWMQQIVHGLRTNGSMDFEEISGAVPWIEMAHDMGLDPESEQAADPRAFKSHVPWDLIPKGGRYIVVFRDPEDACLSLHRFFDGWFFEAGTVGLEEFARDFYLQRPDERGYWYHAASWFRVCERADVLAFCYEDLKDDLHAVVARVADFIGFGGEMDRIEIAARQAEFGFMKAHASQFDDHLTRITQDPACGLPPGGDVTKVSEGKAGRAKDLLSPETRAAFATQWRKTLGAEFGLQDYAALRRAVSAR